MLHIGVITNTRLVWQGLHNLQTKRNVDCELAVQLYIVDGVVYD